MEKEEKINVLIVGATGNLGCLIARYCLVQPNLIVHILDKNLEQDEELLILVSKAGGNIIKADITKPDTIKGVTEGMHTVILALSITPKVLLEGQKAIIDDCIANGVKRIVPTEYVENFADFTQEELTFVPIIQIRRKIEEYLKSLPVKVLQLNTGMWIESAYSLLFAHGFYYWNDPNFKFQLTSIENAAQFVAAAVAKKDLEGRLTYVATEATVVELTEFYNKVRGTKNEAKLLGSLEDLKEQAQELRSTGDTSSWAFELMPLIYDERSRFKETANKDFPEIKPIGIEEVLKEKPELKVFDGF